MKEFKSIYTVFNSLANGGQSDEMFFISFFFFEPFWLAAFSAGSPSLVEG